jgi:hypothetical protein
MGVLRRGGGGRCNAKGGAVVGQRVFPGKGGCGFPGQSGAARGGVKQARWRRGLRAVSQQQQRGCVLFFRQLF